MPSKKNYNKDNAPDTPTMTEQELLAAQDVDMLTAEQTAGAVETPWGETVSPPVDEEQEKTFAPCAYAGDPEDSVCSQCDGQTCNDGNDTYPANECGGYAVPEPETEAPADEAPSPQETDTQQVARPKGNDYVPVGVTSTIRAEIAITREVTNMHGEKVWAKASYSEYRTLPADLDQNLVEQETNCLWDDVLAEVETHINRVIEGQLQ